MTKIIFPRGVEFVFETEVSAEIGTGQHVFMLYSQEGIHYEQGDTMFVECIVLDASMSVSAVLARLARYGLWLDAQQSEAHAWIAEIAKRLQLPLDDTARRLSRDPQKFGAAIRRQWYANVLWYSRPLDCVLHACVKAAPGDTLLIALDLHEPDSRPPLAVPSPGHLPEQEGVVLDGGTPVAISVHRDFAAVGPSLPPPSEFDFGGIRSTPRGPTADQPQAPSSTVDIRAWPRLDAPDYSPARTRFDVVVGLTAEQQAHVLGDLIRIPVPAGATTVDVTVELMAAGVDATDGWTRVLRIDPADPTAAHVIFRLVGRDPAGPEPVHLTMIEVRYVFAGAVCGTASRPLVIGRASDLALGTQVGYGTPWLAQPATAAPLALTSGEPAADLTIELAKPDGNDSNGRYVCRLRSTHDIPLDAGPHDVDLGDDAKTFAKSSVVDQVRQHTGDVLIENFLNSIGDLVAEKLPAAAFDGLREVAKRVSPNPPAVLIESAEPYVPWELARMQPPLDAARPPYLGAQTLLGRWLRDRPSSSPSLAGAAASAVVRIEKPPAQPPAAISVRDMAVMVGLYNTESGQKRLPAAEKEAVALVESYDAIPLAATPEALKQLLDAKLEHGFRHVGAAGAVHFAGHGEFDPNRPDSAMLFLNNGKPLDSLVFRSASYGGKEQPLLFLNACMVGTGGALLGNMGGFPGNCLRGGFGAVLGALWEVDDTVAAQIALEFWRRALPVDGAEGEPVGAILRDLRAKFSGDAVNIVIPTYLAYVFYGHPRLKLRRQKS